MTSELFTRMHLVERVASGIPRLQEAKLPEPEFHTDGMFTVVFKRKYSIMSDTVNDTVNEKEQEVLKLLKLQAGLNATEIAHKLGKSIPTVKRYLSSLTKFKLVEFRGAPKTGGYYIKD